eukprot:TRINITY_DN24839_c0_g1_i1.p1 TRINITY_DN24839_c0_g1~~TRINITY_DN24839_c0_g1_i1.p1  ORF type:complete len:209 (+),score=50.32 TRINITY_DN24839_c0_g1_i1:110-736(+)
MHAEEDSSIKVIVVGDGAVGKTSMITRFAKGIYTDEYKKTIGVDFLERTAKVDAVGEDLTYLLWDTAGQDEYSSVTKMYYQGAGACVIVFASDRRESFESINKWHEAAKKECGEITYVLVQNKCDLNAAVQPEEVQELAKKLDLKLFQTSVKDDVGVNDVFQHIGTAFVKSQTAKAKPPAAAASPSGAPEPAASTAEPKKNPACCNLM